MLHPIRHEFIVTIIASIVALALKSCAQPPQDPDALAEYNHNHDPAESTNRKIFAVNKFANDYALKPVAPAYKKYPPDPAQHGIHNFIGNLQEPQIAVNDILQGNFKRAGNTTIPFAVMVKRSRFLMQAKHPHRKAV